MKIKSIHLNDFKRFTDLKIEGIPEEAKLVVMIGPNGCGKSSVFDALQTSWYSGGSRFIDTQAMDYYNKHINYYVKSDQYPYRNDHLSNPDVSGISMMYRHITVDFWDIQTYVAQGSWELAREARVRVRSAYRNDAIDKTQVIAKTDSIEEHRFFQLIENDTSIISNYKRLLSRWVKITSDSDPNQNEKKIGELQNELLGELRRAVSRLFGDLGLVFKNLGNSLDGDILQFDKGTSKGFPYQCLASGTKAALDLLLDIVVTNAEFDNALFCIDEPEAHIHTKLQGQLLEELYNLIPEKSQLWIATHSVGMVRKAQDLWRSDNNSVVFLDFGKDEFGRDRNFDGEVTIKPAKPNPDFWVQTYDVALGDLSELITSECYVFCEGEDFDAECYQNIFKERIPVTRFISIGGRNNVVNAVSKLKGKIAKAAKVSGIIDRDRATEQEIEEATKKEVRTLSRKSIESYLLDDEVLTKLSEHYDKPDETQNLLTAKNEALKKQTSEGKSKSPDDLKPIAQDIHVAAQNALKSVNLGNSKESFMRDILAPLIQPGMKVYEELHGNIFGK